jgi:CelD/BcsL family acetyltransferase involved in cellulose biosynthesis
MSFRVLQAHGVDEIAWLDVLARYPAHLRDLHYTPAYGRIYEDTYGQRPLLAVMERDGNTAMHAFVRRPLDDLPCLAQAKLARRYEDIATPYGFGGPLLAHPERSDSAQLLRDFDAAYRAWCVAERLPAEFVCLHPVLGNAASVEASGIVDPVPTKQVVIVDLTPPVEQLWSAVSRGTRSSIQRARREGIAVDRVEADRAALDRFQQLYLATMTRVGAAQRWLFPEAYFRACVDRLGPAGSALFFAHAGGELAAAYLLIFDGRTSYYHFGASDERWLALRPNNLLMYETMLWAKAQGCAHYHLGGGVSSAGNDTLLRFKSSFGGRRVPLYTYGRVLDADVYRELCDAKCRHEARSGAVATSSDYFPLYRR